MGSQTNTTFKVCEYCGKKLNARYCHIEDKKFFMGFEECDCEKAIEEANRYNAERIIEERKLEHEKRLKRYYQAGIKPRFIDAICPETDAMVLRLKEGKSVYIVGDVGVGKTYYATAIVKHLIDSGKSVKVIDTPRLMSSLKGTFGSDLTEDQVMYEYTNCDVLMLDDMGKETPTDWVLMQLFRLVNERYEQMRPVIITTQFAPRDLANRLARNGDKETAKAIVSRLAESCQSFHMSGKDRRLEKLSNG